MRVFNPKRLQDARKEYRHSQSSLAGEVELSRNAIAQYESGDCVPGSNVLVRLSEVLRKPLEYFFDEVDQSTAQKAAS
jgi:transcriptional regulator with XRE-family HTH domain